MVVAPVRSIGREWRFVVARGAVLTGSGYDAATRRATLVDLGSAASRFAAEVVAAIPAPAQVFVLDVCEVDGALRLLELNPFGGADLYACDAGAVVEAVTSVGS